MHTFFPAPELEGITEWIHSNPLTMKSLRGKVVGIEFFSLGCGHCQNAIPKMQEIFEEYGSDGFVLIGVHTPEFKKDKKVAMLKKFLMKEHLTFPIAVDNEMKLWQAYGNQYWPTLYLIDKKGRVRERHIGEGGYHRIKHDIIHLLKENY